MKIFECLDEDYGATVAEAIGEIDSNSLPEFKRWSTTIVLTPSSL